MKGSCSFVVSPAERLVCGAAPSGSRHPVRETCWRGSSPVLLRGGHRRDAALWGVFLHGEAGAHLSKTIGQLRFLAREIAGCIPRLFVDILRSANQQEGSRRRLQTGRLLNRLGDQGRQQDILGAPKDQDARCRLSAAPQSNTTPEPGSSLRRHRISGLQLQGPLGEGVDVEAVRLDPAGIRLSATRPT